MVPWAWAYIKDPKFFLPFSWQQSTNWKIYSILQVDELLADYISSEIEWTGELESLTSDAWYILDTSLKQIGVVVSYMI